MRTYTEARDRLLERDVRDVLAHDRRLAALAVEVRVDGAVAHVDGEVADHDDARLLRRVIGRVAGILGVWDLLRVAGEAPRVIDIGCGATKQKAEAIGLDLEPAAAVDVVADLERRLPLADDSVDHVFAVHVLEHVHDLFALLAELHRVLKPTGVLHVMVPEWRHPNAVADPTHVRFFGRLTFRDFVERDRGWRFEPATLAVTEDTVFADLEPVNGMLSVPYDDVIARFFV
jgi:SAM-dependent methyltransferase